MSLEKIGHALPDVHGSQFSILKKPKQCCASHYVGFLSVGVAQEKQHYSPTEHCVGERTPIDTKPELWQSKVALKGLCCVVFCMWAVF